MAEVFMAQPGSKYIPVKITGDNVKITSIQGPSINITSLDGWWVKDGKTSFNLDVQVNGPIQATWGGENWVSKVKPGEAEVRIQVRDTDGDGIPDWDWRTVIPAFPGMGILRSNYMERECKTPFQFNPGLVPLWPYLTDHGNYEQASASLRPPIVVDWSTGAITYFSELVTARNQNCSYTLYSIEPMAAGKLNHPDFEVPYAFYDLSGQGLGYPNLILRTEHYPANNPWVGGGNPEYEGIRYSWRNVVGDWFWDYKVDVMGLFPYDFETPIAAGPAVGDLANLGSLTTVDAPPYGLFPSWVVNRAWPAVTFVDSEGAQAKSSEGIYTWSSSAVGKPYIFGYLDAPSSYGYTDITPGYRGEYRFQQARPPELYFSPIDRQLHLAWAEGGIWRLDNKQIIRVSNLEGGEYIDAWSRELMAPQTPGDVNTKPGIVPTPPNVIEALYALKGYLLHTQGTSLTLVANNYTPSIFETLPPTDHATWETQIALLASFKGQRRDPANLGAWLDAFSGPRSTIAGATLANLRFVRSAYRFELTLAPGFTVTGQDLLGVAHLAPGQYLVENAGNGFTARPLTPARISLVVTRPSRGNPAASVWVTVGNSGLADASSLILSIEVSDSQGDNYEIYRKVVDGLAGQTTRVLAPVPAALTEGSALRLQLQDAKGSILAMTTIQDEAVPLSLALERRILGLSTADFSWLGWPLGLALFAAVPLVGLRRRWVKPGKAVR